MAKGTVLSVVPTTPIPNEHPQASVDAFMLAVLRQAIGAKNKKQGELRSAYSTADLRGLNTDAAKIALKLVDAGGDAIDEYFANFKKVGEYVGLLGKTLAPAQYEMFGPKVGPLPEPERAALEGRAAGFDLEPGTDETKNPYEIGSLKGQAWLSAFRDARGERDSIKQMPSPEPDTDDTEGDEGKA